MLLTIDFTLLGYNAPFCIKCANSTAYIQNKYSLHQSSQANK